MRLFCSFRGCHCLYELEQKSQTCTRSAWFAVRSALAEGASEARERGRHHTRVLATGFLSGGPGGARGCQGAEADWQEKYSKINWTI